MNLNKTFGRVATTLVAATMLASVTAVPAFATGIGSNGIATDTDLSGEKVTFTKVYRMPENVKVPAINFTYTVAGVDPKGETRTGGEGTAEKNVAVSQGTAPIVGDTVVSTEFSAAGEASNDVQTYNATVELTLPEADDYKVAGIYKYTVTETTNEISEEVKADLTMGGAHTLYVYVENNDDYSGLVISNVEFCNENGLTSGKTNTWVNYYKLDGDPDNEDPDNPPEAKANELVIHNAVEGTMADMTKKFEYKVTITSNQAVTANIEKYENNQWKVTQKDVKLSNAFQLGDDEQLHVYGLTSGDTYSINPTSYASEGYEQTVEGYTASTTPAFGNTNVTVNYTNKRDAVSPTGIVMNVAPYVLLVVVAAAGCFVFLRKRRED